MRNTRESYAKKHNLILRKYRRHSVFGFWSACFSLVALIIYLPSIDLNSLSYQIVNNTIESAPGAFGFGLFSNFISLFSTIYFYNNLSVENINIGYYGISIAFSILISLFMACTSYFAYKGKKWALITNLSFFSFDFLLLFLFFIPSISHPVQFMNVVNILISVILHAVTIGFLVLAIFDRNQLIKLKKDKDNLMNNSTTDESKVINIISLKKDKSNEDINNKTE